MAVNSASNRVDAVGTGAQVAFPYTFNVYTASDLQVYVDGVLQTINTNYTLSTVNVPGGITGGTATFTSAPANGAAVLLLRVLPYTQATQFTNLDKFDAKSAVEGSFDKGVMQTQQLVEQIGRAVTIPATSLLHPVLMPDPTIPGNFGAGLKIKGDGTGVDTFIINQGNITGLVTTKGDILIFGAGVADRLGVGANNTLLVADSTQAKGLKWSSSLSDLTLVNAALSHPTLSDDVTGLLNILTGQIQFPATQNPSANVNTLDDYEEGTWTPSLGGNTSYTNQQGTYTKIGRLVFVQFVLFINALGTGSASTISGLPFTAATLNAEGSCEWFQAAASYTSLFTLITGGGTSITFKGTTAAATQSATQSPFASSTQIIGSITYISNP